LPLCDRCGEEIAIANDLDQIGDIDRRRHIVVVAGKQCRLAPTLWRLFTLLYRHRGDVVDNDRVHAELCCEMEQPTVANGLKENVRRLRKALAGSRYEIVNHPTLGYELIIKAQRRARRYRCGRKAMAMVGSEPEGLAKDG
jgi:DNA-binding response OmpR family regulator